LVLLSAGCDIFCPAEDFLWGLVGRDVEPVDIFEGFEPGSLSFCQPAGIFLYKLDCIIQSHPASQIKQLVLSDAAAVLRAQRQLQTV
jgi:hypothetical protein